MKRTTDENPFMISFGEKPIQYVSRMEKMEKIVTDFSRKVPSTRAYVITGVRGSGKTVMMSAVKEEFEKREDWMVLELNIERDMLQSLAAKLYQETKAYSLIKEKEFNFSLLGFGGSVKTGTPIADVESAISVMLEKLDGNGKRVLVCVDEAVNNQNMRVFAASFQILIRQSLPIYLLMTGLHENLESLQNERSLTFLYRMPRIVLEPLNHTAICNQYRTIFNLETEEAVHMARLTRGFSFAFQVLGYLLWESDGESVDAVLPEYDQCLSERVYAKIWSELSELDRQILTDMAINNHTVIGDIRESLKMTSGKFGVYRKRLSDKGLLDTNTHGRVTFALPRFEDFVRLNSYYD